MRLLYSLILILVLSRVGSAAEVRLLNGTVQTGNLVAMNEREITLKTAAGPVTTALAGVLEVKLEAPLGVAKGVKYADVELIDGSLLHCTQFGLKGKEVELTLLSGQKVKVGLDAVHYLLNDAQDEKNRKDWKERFIAQKRTSDLIGVVSAGGTINKLPGTLGEGDAEGGSIMFDLRSAGSPRKVKLDNVHGLLFLRTPPANPPAVLCKLYDTADNLVIASGVTMGPAGFSVTTPAGVKLDYQAKLVSRLDFSKGKLTFLSALEPSRVNESSTEERIEHYRKNKNLDDQRIQLRVPKDPQANPAKVALGDTILKAFDNGLALHSRTELEYDLGGDYNEFKATIGVDETVGGTDGAVIVTIEGDGRELFTANFTRKDVARNVSLNVKNVNRLRILVASGDLLDLGKHAVLADARVSK
jgi:hypothetical protein